MRIAYTYTEGVKEDFRKQVMVQTNRFLNSDLIFFYGKIWKDNLLTCLLSDTNKIRYNFDINLKTELLSTDEWSFEEPIFDTLVLYILRFKKKGRSRNIIRKDLRDQI